MINSIWYKNNFNKRIFKSKTILSHPVGIDGQNHIIAVTPLKFLPVKEFEKQQKSIDLDTTPALMNSAETKHLGIIQKKQLAKELKENGNKRFRQKKYNEAENLYSQAIELNRWSRPLWTNRAACRNMMKKFDEAISDCEIALSIDSKCTRSIRQKGNALLDLNRFDEARECYESLRSLGEDASAETNLKKLHDAQDRIRFFRD